MSEDIKNPLIKKDRDFAHDIAKAIGILLVMQVHIFDYPKWYLIVMAITGVWLMPFYFTLSGYYYQPGKRTPWQSIKRRTLQLVKPYFIYSITIWIITTAYNLITSSMTLKECAKQYLAFLLSRHSTADVQTMGAVTKGIPFTTVVGTFWFVVIMFFADILFFLIADWTLASMKRFFSVTSGLVFISFFLNLVVDSTGKGLPLNIQNVPMATALILIGAMFGKHKVLSKDFTSKKWMVINSLVTLALIMLIQLKFGGAGAFAAGIFMYNGALDVFPCVLYGIMTPFMVICLSRLLEKIPLLSKALIWIGFRSLPILLVHMVISTFIARLTGIEPRALGQYGVKIGESALNFALTLAVIVIYRTVWEFILKKIYKNKLSV
ncbi:MAG: acyltransferase family protein [Clostridia bacterium]|nr:acyltransferase family protein [Clostridia bacterium]